ncbi:MAG: two-component regulator propeller domain-containing protein [Chitinophagales bacterium]
MSVRLKYRLHYLFITSCLFFLWIGNPLLAQTDISFEHLTTENGLSENVIYSIVQDSKGYLWIGTDNGLNRYNGYEFKKFRYNASDNNSLPSNTINSICEDSQGNIWLGTNQGLCKYNYIDGKFLRVPLEKDTIVISQVITVNENELMFKSGEKVVLINIHTLKETMMKYKQNGKPIFNIRTANLLSKDKNGNIYLSMTSEHDQIWLYDSLQKNFIEFIDLSLKKRPIEYITYCFMDSRNHLWVGTSDRRLLCNLPGGVTEKRSQGLSEVGNDFGVIMNIYEDNDGNIWISTTEGLWQHNYATGKMFLYRHDNSLTAISSDAIYTVYQDRTGVIWIGTLNGVNKVNPYQYRFRHLTTNSASQQALINNFVLGIYPLSKNQVRINYVFGVPYFSIWNVAENTLHNYSFSEYSFLEYLKQVAFRNPEHFNLNNLNKALPILHELVGIKNIPPGSLISDDKQNIWYNRGDILVQLNTSQRWKFGFYIVDMQVYGDDIWMATTNSGLVCFNITQRNIIKFTPIQSNGASISSSDVTCFIIEKNGNMWIGTKGGGLNYFDRQKKIFQHYTEEDGLCNNSIYCMVKDDSDRIWLGTSNGLSCFDPSTHKFSNYFRPDGLVNSEYNRYSACKLENGFIFMGGTNGIDYFHPDRLIRDKIKPQVQITDFKIFNKSIYPIRNFSLSHTENYITIEFAAMDFINPAGNKFAYKLEGIDRDWVFPENRNFAIYSVLSPGTYHFLVKAANSDGIWNEQPSTIDFTIKTPWWKSWWFYACCILVTAVLLFWVYRSRINQLKKLIALRTKISQDLHDEVGATLSSIHVYSSVASKTMENDPDKAMEALQHINENTRQVMENMNDIVWAVNINNVGETSLASKLKNYGYELLTSMNIKCDYYIDKEAENKLVNIEARKNILLIAKEAMNNIAKYSDAAEVIVRLGLEDKKLFLEITDNGKGFSTDDHRVGNGLFNMKKRTEILKGDFRVTSAKNKGTTIRCSVPLTNIRE